MFNYTNPFNGWYNPYYQRNTWIEVIRDFKKYTTHSASVKRKRKKH